VKVGRNSGSGHGRAKEAGYGNPAYVGDNVKVGRNSDSGHRMWEKA
jgi:hypothetical protein